MANNTSPALERQAEIDVGYDAAFERKWGQFERFVWLVFVILIIAGLLGILGRGPLNKVKRTLPDGSFLEYERVVRFKSPSVVSFTIPAERGMARIEASKVTVQKLGLQQVIPQPSQDLGSDQVGPIQFQAASPTTNSVYFQLAVQPDALGPVTSRYSINGQTTVQVSQFVVP